jgi:hypothetical protein
LNLSTCSGGPVLSTNPIEGECGQDQIKGMICKLAEDRDQHSDRKPQGVRSKITAGHLLHPEPDFQFLDEVFNLASLVMKANNFRGRQLVPVGGDDIIGIAF